MGLSIQSRMVADVDVQGITLRSALGSFELMFGLNLHVSAHEKATQRISIAGAEVFVSFKAAKKRLLGFARPQGFFDIRTQDFSSRSSHALYLPIQPWQIGAIEDFRNGGDLDFELHAWGQYMDGDDKQQVNDTWRKRIARSEWLQQLQQTSATDVLLIEVPMPADGEEGHWREVTENLQSAERHFGNGEYTAAVASCRVAVDELGHQLYKSKSWPADFNKKFCTDREKMEMEDREGLILSAIRHFAHQAHHGPGDGGKTHYSRSQAKRTLALAAAVIAHAREA